MRASLLASATASLCRCKRSDAAFSHAPKLNRDQVCGRIRRTLAAWTSNMRKYRLPRLAYVRFDLTVTEHTQWWRRCRLIECGAGAPQSAPTGPSWLECEFSPI